MKLVIVDYGMGNLKSLTGALNHIGVQNISVTNNLDEIDCADKLILPGVGAFKLAMKNIKNLNLDKALRSNVLDKKKPLLGICLGMQLLTNSSTEGGLSEGLQIVPGKVTRFKGGELSVPHVGINQVNPFKGSKLYTSIPQESIDFYFVHSYKMTTNEEINQSNTHYISEFVSSFEKDNIVGVQYHPELSQSNGLKVLSNFISLF